MTPSRHLLIISSPPSFFFKIKEQSGTFHLTCMQQVVAVTLREKHETPVAATRPTGALGNQTHKLLSITNKQTPLEPLPLSSINIHGNKNVQNCLRTECYLFQLLGVGPEPPPLPTTPVSHPPSLPPLLSLCPLLLICCSISHGGQTPKKTCADLQHKTKPVFAFFSAEGRNTTAPNRARRLECAGFKMSSCGENEELKIKPVLSK